MTVRRLIISLSLVPVAFAAFTAVIAFMFYYFGSSDATAGEIRHQIDTNGITFEYTQYTDEGDQISINHDLDLSSANDVDTFAHALTDHASQIIASEGSERVELIFVEPVSIDEYAQMMEDLGTYPTANRIDAEGPDGWVGYEAPPARAEGSDRVVAAIDKEELSRFKHSTHEVLGVVTARGVELTEQQFEQAMSDSRIYAVAAFESLITDDLDQRSGPSGDAGRMQVRPTQLYFHMVETGIAPPRDYAEPDVD